MKNKLVAMTAMTVVFGCTTAFENTALAANVGVSVSVGQPGFYGQIDVGDFPRPQLLYRQPQMVERIEDDRPPIYLRVPPGHARHWSRHCREYNACGERVLFVRDDWYNREYVPRYQNQHREHSEDHRDGRWDDHRRDSGNGHHGDRHDEGREH